MHVPAGLRERKRAQTRQAIADAAIRLFTENGFESTTIADIAAAADIAPRTFFGYFPSKEDVAFHDFERVFGELETALEARSEGETTFDVLRRWIVERADEAVHADDLERRRHELVRATPALQDHKRSKLGQFQTLLTRCLAVDLGEPEDGLRPQMVGAAAVAAMESLERWYEDREPEALSTKDAGALLDEALVFLRGGMDALASQPAPRREAA
ncbi:TetR family transcriptional regulator [Conexibacter sp. SYSU D00693]|uniref:TetR family transcriptional regulator n=1 Tax=Conexibacter sp. SYSU D00693 TaxID=2812560 RepID=UPI00196A72E0|nr:TetR family transcriptional regulator [Conexibacter sp. SYSU D00693]